MVTGYENLSDTEIERMIYLHVHDTLAQEVMKRWFAEKLRTNALATGSNSLAPEFAGMRERRGARENLRDMEWKEF